MHDTMRYIIVIILEGSTRKQNIKK